jgi:RNA polymerase sigma-70 factor (ECF subfamily)
MLPGAAPYNGSDDAMKGSGRLDLAGLKQGDKAAWDAFVARYAGVVHAAVGAVLRQAGRPAGDAADVAQDVFLKLCKDGFRLLGTYDPARAALSTWLTVVARSTALDSLRRRRPPSIDIDDAPESALAVPAHEPQHLRIPDGLLSPRQALILTMLYDREMDPGEVAAALGIDAQTVRSMHHKALTRLRAHFVGADGDT